MTVTSGGCKHALSGSRPPPRPTLKRRAESTTGAAAPSLARADAPRQPRASRASGPQRGRSRPRRCGAPWCMRMRRSQPRRPARRSSVGLKARRALPRPRWRVRMFRASGASCAQRGRVRSRRRCASWCVRMLRASPAPAGLRALSADVYVRAGVARPGVCACSAPAPRRAESTKGAAAPSHWGMRMLRASPASAGLRALSVGVYVRAGVVRLDGCACGALNFLSMHDCTLRACHG